MKKKKIQESIDIDEQNKTFKLGKKDIPLILIIFLIGIVIKLMGGLAAILILIGLPGLIISICKKAGK